MRSRGREVARSRGHEVVVVVLLLGLASADRSPRLSVPEVAAAQGRHDPAVPQLLSVRPDVAEEAERRARQAGPLQQYVLRRVRALAAHQTARRRAPEIVALLAGARRVASDSVQVARRAAPVACPELVDVNRVVTCFIEDRLRHPVPHDPPEEAVMPATTPGPGGGAADSSGDGADIHRYPAAGWEASLASVSAFSFPGSRQCAEIHCR